VDEINCSREFSKNISHIEVMEESQLSNQNASSIKEIKVQ
jgi:hypothetical protein